MGWKKKEKELSLDEALDQARAEQARCWLQSPPLVTAFSTPDGGHAAFPLEPSFRRTRWLAAHLDPFSIEGIQCLRRFIDLRERYEVHDLKPLIIARSKYECIQKQEALGAFLRDEKIPVVAVIDESGSLQRAYGVDVLPALQLIEDGSVHRDGVPADPADPTTGLPAWIAGFEAGIQRTLRLRDPGLPLRPVLEFSARDFLRTRRGWQFGLVTASSSGGKAPLQGIDSFARQGSGWSSAEFPAFGVRPLGTDDGVELAGKWSMDAHRVVTRDPHAEVRFRARGASLRLVMEPLFPTGMQKRPTAVMISVAVNGLAVFDEQAGEDLRSAEDGGTEITLDSLRFAEVLRDFEQSPVEIRLGFRGVEEVPVAIYGIELGERV